MLPGSFFVEESVPESTCLLRYLELLKRHGVGRRKGENG
jgi:hypothetical protein